MLSENQITIDPHIFRRYDIRGVVDETLTEETVHAIGCALATFARDHDIKTIIIGRDGRTSSPWISKTLKRAILASGCNVLDIGLVPTPLVYFAAALYPDHAAVMITGSHNPANYNGFKIVAKNKALTADELQSLLHYIQTEKFSSGQGQERTLDLIPAYSSELQNKVILKNELHVVIDAGNGATAHIVPQIFTSFGCKVTELFCEVDGRFPNHHPDPSRPENLQDLIAKVRETNADLGIAFDGDGDRLGVVTNQGEIIWPDRLLMLYAEDLLENHPESKIIFDVKCTQNLVSHIEKFGGEPIIWKTGHSLIKAKLAETQSLLAGEMSGHVFFKDKWYGFDDALYAALRLCEIISKREQSLHEIFAQIPDSINTPEIKIPVAEKEKQMIMDKLFANTHLLPGADLLTIDGMRVNFADGWGLIRPSNTTPDLILRFEAKSEKNLKEIQEKFRTWIQSTNHQLKIPF